MIVAYIYWESVKPKRQRIGSRHTNREIVLCTEGPRVKKKNSETSKENTEIDTNTKNTKRKRSN